MKNEFEDRQIDMCRREYIRLAREMRRKGLSQDAIETCRTTLVDLQDDRWFLKPIAFRPTGLALGCPLPNRRAQKIFYRAAQLVEKWLRGGGDAGLPVFAYVPPDAYHITVVNRSHYDFNEVVPLTADEKSVFETAVAQLQVKQVSLVTSGLFLTCTGRLFVKCLVFDDSILRLRSFLSETYPQLRTNLPRLVHIKIGHLMKVLEPQQLLEFGAWLERLGHHTITRIDFTDLYTPAGRIGL